MNGPVKQMDSNVSMHGIIEKPWGHERIIEHNDTYVVKELYVRAGHRLSFQYHEQKTETLTLVDGAGLLKVRNKKWPMKLHIPYHIKKRVPHRISALRHSDCLIVEISTTELDDVVRIEDDYGRTPPAE